MDLRRHGHYRKAATRRSSGPFLAERSPFPHRPATSWISWQAGPGTQSTVSRSALRPAGGLRDRSLLGVVTAQGDRSLPSPHCCHTEGDLASPGSLICTGPGCDSTRSPPTFLYLPPRMLSSGRCPCSLGGCGCHSAVSPRPRIAQPWVTADDVAPQVSSTAGLLGSPPPHDTVPISPGQTCHEHCHPL